ncbi:LacI family transcriptional regulator [Pseudomonas sp. PIC25]|uniref:ABC transporter substrate-binding protein n=1 Tax=Pseudomonas sp. PIC25 TaxID=1958773 RepID=UPI000BAB4ECF|nr:ABC transporter substrate-binding protein [Pseudomonas sp. PIC25]PAU66287.1 LacI family transcriptional regulator [Pseudomonas sp. PIC25]
MLLRLFLFLFCLFGSLAAHATSVVFLNPGRSTEVFWVGYTRFMQAAADDLGFELTVLYGERDAQRTLQQARDTLGGEALPDYLLFVNEEHAGPEILRLAAGKPVKLFSVNSHLTEEQQRYTGNTRENHPNWIGSMVPNDEEAGYLMARALFVQAEQGTFGEIELIAFAGNRQTPASRIREAGLQRALAEHPRVRLRQMVYGEWNRQRAYEQAQLLLPRYPQTRVIWAANDEMAFGAMQALEERHKVPGRDVLFSALNTSREVLQARIDGRISALVGGHFTLGGWALVLLHDYDAGLDFAAHGGKDRQVPLFRLLDEKQSRRLMQRQEQKGFGLDFRKFTLQGWPDAKDYRFSLDALLD